jgi:hypothetical protein
MTAAQKDLYIEQGATFVLSFAWLEGTAATPGDPHDLTDATARMQIRPKAGQAPLVDVSSDGVDPAIVLGGTAGTVLVTLTDTATDALTVKKGVYDLEVDYGGGEVYRLLEGKVVVSPNVTQAVT